MTETAENVLSGVTGALYFAPSGTALPTTTGAALNAAFDDVGYISEDGVVIPISSDTNQVKAWQNGSIVAEYEVSHLAQLKFKALETNPTSLELFYGNYDGSGSEGVSLIKAGQIIRGCWVLDIVDDTNVIRFVFPDGKVVNRDDLTIKNGEPIAYGMTITFFEDASGNKGYKYLATVGAS